MNLKVFSNIDKILATSVSQNALDSNKTRGELVQNEAITTSTFFKWVGFLCVLGLVLICSSLLGLVLICSSLVQCYYKSTRSILK